MTLISTIITDAYRETNLIARGSTETLSEQTEALRLLGRYIEALFGNEAGDPMIDVLYGRNANVTENLYNNEFELFVDNYYMPPGFRAKLNLSTPKTIKLLPNPENGAIFGIVDASNNLATYPITIDGNGSLIEGVTDLVINTNGYSGSWFYRADKANWQRISNLLATDESPFPTEFDDLLIVGLAMRLDPRNGSGINPLSLEQYRNTLKKFRARYTQVTEKSMDLALARIDGRRRVRNSYSLQGEFERGNLFRYSRF